MPCSAALARLHSPEQICRMFVKENPDIGVDAVVYPWAQYWTKVQVQAASGLAPDVITLYSGNIGVWIDNGAYSSRWINSCRTSTLTIIIRRRWTFAAGAGSNTACRSKYRSERWSIPQTDFRNAAFRKMNGPEQTKH